MLPWPSVEGTLVHSLHSGRRALSRKQLRDQDSCRQSWRATASAFPRVGRRWTRLGVVSLSLVCKSAGPSKHTRNSSWRSCPPTVLLWHQQARCPATGIKKVEKNMFLIQPILALLVFGKGTFAEKASQFVGASRDRLHGRPKSWSTVW